MKKIRFLRGATLDDWTEENELEKLRDDIQCHCEVYLEGEVGNDPTAETPEEVIREAQLLTRLILISVRDALE